jgi:hypothetical protein
LITFSIITIIINKKIDKSCFKIIIILIFS